MTGMFLGTHLAMMGMFWGTHLAMTGMFLGTHLAITCMLLGYSLSYDGYVFGVLSLGYEGYVLGYSLGYDGYAERLGHGADELITVGVARAFLRVAPVDRQRRDAARLDHPRELHRLLNLPEKHV